MGSFEQVYMDRLQVENFSLWELLQKYPEVRKKVTRRLSVDFCDWIDKLLEEVDREE